MNIWVIELGEPLPLQPGQRLLRYGELTRVLARRGHRVTWWACDFSHQTRGFVGAPNARLDADGVEIVLVHGPGYRRNVGLGRLRHVAAHARNLAALVADQPPPDIVLTAMPTIEACEVAVSYGAKARVPVVVDIRDEWPEDYVRWLPPLLRGAGRLMLSTKFKALQRICKDAAALTSVTERQLAYGLARTARPRKPDDAVFHTGASNALPAPGALSGEIAHWHGEGLAEGDFVCAFAGTMAPSRPLSCLIDAVMRLRASTPIKLVVAGTGDLESQYRAQAGGSDAVIFSGWINAPRMQALFQIADVLVAPYSPDYGFSMPTKIFDYMAASRPLLSSCPGEAEELIRTERIGLQFKIDDRQNIEDALMTLYRDPETRLAMGSRARQVFESRFALEAILERYADYLEGMSGRK